MATKAKDHSNSSTSTTALAKKERVATTIPSNSQAKTTSTKSSTTQGSSSTHKPSSSSTEKQVPNYLKPTISSRQDSATPKPSLNRRRSFDNKPPSPASRPQKVVPERSTVPVRSSSFSSKTASKTAPRPTTKPQTLYAKSVKKGAEIFVRKEGPSGRGADPKSSTKDNNEVAKDEELAKESLVHEVVDSNNVVVDGDDHQTELVKVAPEDEPKSEENHENESIDDHGHDHQDETKAKPCDITIVSEELVTSDDDNEDTDHKKLESTEEEEGEEEKPGDESEVGEQENHNKDETSNCTTSETSHQITKESIENEETKVEELIKEEAEEVVKEETQELENKNIDNVGSGDKEGKEDGVKSKEIGEISDENVEDLGNTSETKSEGIVKKSAQGGGKKESQVAYNDVIEETASKLLEKRKNKVKALVGAFETVIDYESAAK
ncbi:hypothetical protein L484_019836 [Morus notabilis]|uniref:Calmodulin-binding domain-containing protein n=1 Tax=Morus notabilis TaxID=981085 RepID=W9SK64_9ROSA|nr:sodium/potassium/calcium exchanger 1 [Morus notabilis]EXC32723.1 hypothetical protein L484_019836 [Morus notabilis]